MQPAIKIPLFLVALFVGTLLSISSCKKTDDPGADPTGMAVSGGGFRDVFSDASHTDYNGSFLVPDFTIEDTRLHIVYATTLVSQQGNRYKLFRRTMDMATNTIIPQPAGADTVLEGFNLPSSYYYRGPALFLPYRNFFTHNNYRSNGQRFESTFGGDLEFFYAVYHGYIPSLGFRYPVHNLAAAREGAIGTGPAPGPPSYQTKTYQPKEVSYGYLGSAPIHAMILESYRHSYQDSIFCIAFRGDSIIAYTVSPNGNGQLQTFRKVAGIESFAGVPSYVNGSKLIRHYDPAGNKLAVAILSSKHAYTFTFDFTTLALTRGVENFGMPHEDLSNTDVDDEGNLYYADKDAGFGATTVYKRSIGGVTSVVGADKPLRYGEIVRVKYLLGKVYIAASGRPADGEETHVAVLEQQ